MNHFARATGHAVVLASFAVGFAAGCSNKKQSRIPRSDSAADGGTRTEAEAGAAGSRSPTVSGKTDKPSAGGDANTGTTSRSPASVDRHCAQARSNELIPSRTNATAAGGASEATVFTRDLFSQFYKHCGGCHVDGASGNFHIQNLTEFPSVALQHRDAIETRMTSDDPAVFMPPVAAAGRPFSQRSADDPVRELHSLLQAWFEAGAPAETFERSGAIATTSTDPYQLAPEIAEALTNIGDCLPEKSNIGADADAMGKLDAMFAAASSLPERLDETDLTTFDAAILARTGVIAFAPTYPLYSDGAHKLRLVRVPAGTSIHYDAARRAFDIPANTRFYKTFFKSVVDESGKERWRKMETRLIVSRPDGADAEDGSHENHALFGTYAWNDEETEARLVTDPRRDGKPFADRLITYVTNEGKAQEILASKPLKPLVALREAGVTRTYAIPSSERCVECHTGSANGSFVLGFVPLQIARRPMGEGGVIEPPGADELTQLDRLVDYGVITGIASASDVPKLEDSQAERKPRNEYELTAQGYMLGNCAGCHNSRGYATLQNPQLRDMLRFYPSEDGGIFQFPLSRVSPRIKRGLRQEVSIPYITPSLFDRETPDQDVATHRRQYLPVNERGEVHHQAAPWRSLIYRNVDTPFTYADDFSLYPHMPMNVPGFDCRVPRIIGDWMVSIAARLADPALNERWDLDYSQTGIDASAAGSPQPYLEVLPGDPDYDAALAQANQRLELYHHGGEDRNLFDTNFDPMKATKTIQHPRYDQYCPDTSDIVDPSVGIGSELEMPRLTPDDMTRYPSLVAAGTDFGDDVELAQLAIKVDGVPDRPHWVETDTSDPPGEWDPRRPDWSDILVRQHLDGLSDRELSVVSQVESLRADEAFRTFALAARPVALWVQKPGCDFQSVPKVKLFTPDVIPRWLETLQTQAAVGGMDSTALQNAPVYMQSAGGLVFNEICINCHGPRFDSRGRLADALMLMTGGATRVANLRAGILGPADNPGANQMRVFGPLADAQSTAQDWAARYVAWMGLGGTRRAIPSTILGLVGTAEVFGVKRQGELPVVDANMLTLAQTLCSQVLGRNDGREVAFDPNSGSIVHEGKDGTSLVSSNGDAETWLDLCSFRNQPPVRIVTIAPGWTQKESGRLFRVGQLGWFRPDAFPPTAIVGDDHGELANGIQPGNLAPWCVVGPTDDDSRAVVEQYVTNERAGKTLPFCPQDWLSDPSHTQALSDADLDAWTLRGAINAGVSVFFQLDQQLRDEHAGKRTLPAYDHCEDLAPPH